MTLLDDATAKNGKEYLYAEANRASGYAPFICGIPKGKVRLANCTTVRLYIQVYGGNWIPIIIVKSTKDIPAGHFLYYDYKGENHHPEKFNYLECMS